jgi:DNA polymerase III epsilon subunit-like protein
MYASRSKHVKEAQVSNTKAVEENKSTEGLLQHVVGLLQELVLIDKQRKSEGFPTAIRKGSLLDNSGLKRESLATVLIPLDEAKEVLKSYEVETENENVNLFVATTRQENPGRVFALDCEMVQTAQGSELARITLILLTGVGQQVEDQVSYKVMLDELVKPYGSILDYVTKYSGVTAAIMDPVMTRLEQIQAALISIVHENDVLVGHSLENDLRALRLVHDKVVDTAMVFRAVSGRKYCK